MKILITNFSLSNRTGTELVVYELAKEFHNRGHKVAAYSSRLGDIAESIRQVGVPVLDDPENCTFIPDIIHGQHHLDTITALLAFPKSPAIYHMHGGRPFLEQAPRHNRIYHHVVMCEGLRDKLGVELNLNEADVSTVTNWFDAERYRNVRKLPAVPASAVLFGATFDKFHVLDRLAPVFRRHNIRVETTTSWTAAERQNPELALSRYDIALATGRSAIEASASGCAVLMANHVRCSGWIKATNLPEAQYTNFCPRASEGSYDPDTIDSYLQEYDSASAMQVTAHIRSHCDLKVAASSLLNIYEEVIHQHNNRLLHGRETDASGEIHSLYKYLRRLAPAVMDVEKVKMEFTALEKQLLNKSKESESLKKLIAELEKKINKMDDAVSIVEMLKKKAWGRAALSLAKKCNQDRSSK